MSRVLRETDWRNLAILLLLFAVVSLLWTTQAMYPLQILTTVFHEFSHAFAALISGGTVERIEINANGSGLAFSRGGNPLIIAPAGYIGATLIGALLLFTVRWQRVGRGVLYVLAAVLLVTTILWIRTPFGIFFTLVLAGLFAGIAWRGPNWLVRWFNPLIAAASLRFALDDAWGLVARTSAGQHNDAVILQNATGIPAVLSAGVWTLLALAISLLAFYVVTRKGRRPVTTVATPTQPGAPEPSGEVSRPATGTSRGDLLKQLEDEGLLGPDSGSR